MSNYYYDNNYLHCNESEYRLQHLNKLQKINVIYQNKKKKNKK